MTTVPEMAKAVSEVTDIPLSTVETIVRRLGESGRIPRGTRGRRPPDASSKDLAQTLIAVMGVADGIYGTSARVVQAVEQIGNLSCTAVREVPIADDAEGLDSERENTFLDEITNLIEECSDPVGAQQALRLVRAVGLTFTGETTHGWTEVTAEAESHLGKYAHLYVRGSGGGLRLIFGCDARGRMPGMTREVRVSIDSLVELAKITFPSSATSEPAGDNQGKANERGNRRAAGRHEGENE